MRFVLLSCLIVAVLGSVLYFAKLTVDEQYRRLKQLELEIKTQTEHNYVVQAEWTFLTRPERLLRLSNSLLGMNHITPERILTISSIPMRRSATTLITNADAGVENVAY
tara:strand:+ start:305 stop:631 length:327 start_codon:yes stop_codon:yes gene_type:complete